MGTTKVPRPGECIGLQDGMIPNLPSLTEKEESILHRIALLTNTRGLVIKHCFEDAGRAGKVTEEQFRRYFPLTKDFVKEELDLIIQRYKVVGDNNNNLINYMNLHNEVTDAVAIIKDSPIPVSPYIISEEKMNEKWTKNNYNIIEIITAKIIEKRLRLEDNFSDFDNLRTGYCTDFNLDSVLTTCGLNNCFSNNEVEELKVLYQKKDLNLRMFNYKKFCEDVASASSYKDIHRDPLARISLPNSNVTLPGRRSRRELTEEEKVMINDIETEIRCRIAKRRIEITNSFRDFDKTNQGHITLEQFKRVLASLQIDGGRQDNTQTNLLGKKYCDLGEGSSDLFNYRSFCSVVDPVADSLKNAEGDSKKPYVKPAPSKYFTETGKVFDVSNGQYK